jgi:hypothetical protein
MTHSRFQALWILQQFCLHPSTLSLNPLPGACCSKPNTSLLLWHLPLVCQTSPRHLAPTTSFFNPTPPLWTTACHSYRNAFHKYQPQIAAPLLIHGNNKMYFIIAKTQSITNTSLRFSVYTSISFPSNCKVILLCKLYCNWLTHFHALQVNKVTYLGCITHTNLKNEYIVTNFWN